MPVYGEVEVFENRFMYSRGIDKIATVYGWTTGNQYALSCTNGSTAISLVSSGSYTDNFN